MISFVFNTRIFLKAKGAFLISRHRSFRKGPTILIAMAMIVVLLAITSVQVYSAPITECTNMIFIPDIYDKQDKSSIDDEPSQSDINKMGYDLTNNCVSWNWDDLIFLGDNTGDACALFDTDSDGGVNYALCAQVETDVSGLAQFSIAEGIRFFKCDDRTNKPQNCWNALEVGTFASICELSLRDDPFYNVPGNKNIIHDADINNDVCNDHCTDETSNDFADFDTEDGSCQNSTGINPDYECSFKDLSVTCKIDNNDFDGANPSLINICSYPSGPPNSRALDCIVPPDTGFIVIIKDAGGNTTTEFPFTVTPESGLISVSNPFSITGGTFTDPIPVLPQNYNVTELVPADWQVDYAVCVIPSTSKETGNFNGIDAVTGIEIGKGQTVTCYFHNSQKQGTITVIKHVENDNGGNAQANDFTICLNDDNNTCFSGEESPGTIFTFPAGYSYEVTETGPDGYAATFTGDCSGVIGAEVDKVCTITNDDRAHLKPFDVDLPIAICEDSIKFADGTFNCTIGLMINTGSQTGTNDTARFTDFSDTGMCTDQSGINSSTMEDIINLAGNCDGGNPETVYFGTVIATGEGEYTPIYSDIKDCFKLLHFNPDNGTYQMWSAKLPVIDCSDDIYNSNCSTLIGMAGVHIAWVNDNQDLKFRNVPKFMYGPEDENGDPVFSNWPKDAPDCTLPDCWNVTKEVLEPFIEDLYTYYEGYESNSFAYLAEELNALYPDGWTVEDIFVDQGVDVIDPSGVVLLNEDEIDGKARWASFILYFNFNSIDTNDAGEPIMKPAPWRGSSIYFLPGCDVYIP